MFKQKRILNEFDKTLLEINIDEYLHPSNIHKLFSEHKRYIQHFNKKEFEKVFVYVKSNLSHFIRIIELDGYDSLFDFYNVKKEFQDCIKRDLHVFM